MEKNGKFFYVLTSKIFIRYLVVRMVKFHQTLNLSIKSQIHKEFKIRDKGNSNNQKRRMKPF